MQDSPSGFLHDVLLPTAVVPVLLPKLGFCWVIRTQHADTRYQVFHLLSSVQWGLVQV